MRRCWFTIVLAFALCHFSLTDALAANDPREIAVAKRRELEIKRQEQVKYESQRHVKTVRDLDRIWKLPPEIAAAVADGKIAFEELEFTDDGRLIDNGKIPSALTPRPNGVARESHQLLRAGGLTISVVLLLMGFVTRRRRSVEAVVPYSSRKRRNVEVNPIEES